MIIPINIPVIRLGIIILANCFLIAVTLISCLPTGPAMEDYNGNLKVNINLPQGMIVTHRPISVNGYVSGTMPKGEYLWIVVKSLKTHEWWRMDSIPLSDGSLNNESWVTEYVYIGGPGNEDDINQTYNISVIMVNDVTNTLFGELNRNAEVTDFVKNAKQIGAAVTVKRGVLSSFNLGQYIWDNSSNIASVLTISAFIFAVLIHFRDKIWVNLQRLIIKMIIK